MWRIWWVEGLVRAWCERSERSGRTVKAGQCSLGPALHHNHTSVPSPHTPSPLTPYPQSLTLALTYTPLVLPPQGANGESKGVIGPMGQADIWANVVSDRAGLWSDH